MTQPVACAVAAMVCYGLSDFIYKQAAAAGIRTDHFLMVQAWLFCPLVILYALVVRGLTFDPVALWGSLAGAFIFVGFYCLMRSLAAGPVSTIATIFRLNFIVTVVLVVALLGEPVTSSKVAGLALALSATWLLVGGRTAAGRAPIDTPYRSLVQVAIGTLAFGVSTFFHTVGLRHGAVPEMLAVAQAALFMPLATTVVYSADRKLQPSTITFRYAAAASIALLGATIFLLNGVAGGQASVLVPISQMGFVVAAVLGIFILRERVTVRKTAGFVLALMALAVLAAT